MQLLYSLVEFCFLLPVFPFGSSPHTKFFTFSSLFFSFAIAYFSGPYHISGGGLRGGLYVHRTTFTSFPFVFLLCAPGKLEEVEKLPVLRGESRNDQQAAA